MNNPLLDNLGFNEVWLNPNSVMNFTLAFGCLSFIIYSAFRHSERFARPAFVVAVFVFILYQLPLTLFSPLFYNHLPNAIWFFISIHTAVIINLLWVYATPRLNKGAFAYQQTTLGIQLGKYLPHYFQGLVFWLPLSIFFILLGLYFYKIPFKCTALYAMFADTPLTLLVREMTGKLMGRTYAPHILNILTSGIAPIIALLLIGRIYFDAKAKKLLPIIIWVALLAIAIITPLLGGAKGSLIPMEVFLSVIGFLVAKNWKWKFIIVSSIIFLFTVMIFLVKIAQENSVGSGKYPFGNCVVRLELQNKIDPLLQSLIIQESNYIISKKRLKELLAETTGIETNTISVEENFTYNYNNIKDETLSTKLFRIFYRITASPIQVSSWHYLYVKEYGSPELLGFSIAKLFSDNYINMPLLVCKKYEFVRSGGDQTSTCTAPTSYLFTYPAYLGVLGLLLACFATIVFDVIFALLIKYSVKLFADLTIGVMTVAVVNLIVADYTTVVISHGVGVAVIMLVIIFLYYHFRNKD